MWPFLKRDTNMWLLVGLGNPGDKYKNHRHNIGFKVLESIAHEYGAVGFRSKYQGEYTEVTIEGSKICLLKPLTYMNESGQSVVKAAKFYKIPAERIIVFHDELDLKPGVVRLKTGGGLAGHNGLKSMKNHLGTADFHRVRIGIGHPGDKNRVSGYVLSDFAKAEQGTFETICDVLAHNIRFLIMGDNELFMTKVSDEIR